MNTATAEVPGQMPDVLAQARTLVEPALRTAVDRLHADLARVAAYHGGWISADGEPATSGGKRLRPTLAVLSALTAGSEPAVALPGAVAVELLHEFSLLHDDIMDDDHTRRGRPAAWTVFGSGAAVLSGDALLALALETIAETGRGDLVGALVDTLARLCWGQAEDARFERCDTIAVPEYITMVEGKTGAAMEFACTVGARLAGAPAPLVAGLGRIGAHLGVAFQIVDDILGIWGDPAITGKPVYSDLARGKKTLPILAALASPTSAAPELRNALAGELDDATLAQCAELVEDGAGRTRATSEVTWRRSQAQAALAGLRLPRDVDLAWQSIINKITERAR